MTPQEWNAALAADVPWQSAYANVEAATRSLLSSWPDDEYGSTADLVEELYPAAMVRGDEGAYARKRIFKALMACAPRGLSDCCKKGMPRPRKGTRGHMIQPWEWFKPIPGHGAAPPDDGNCPTCGQPVF
jgi:hypothetical protein